MSDLFRREYRPLSDKERGQVEELKVAGENFVLLCMDIGDSRELSIAKTKMEEAVMWAVKGVTG